MVAMMLYLSFRKIPLHRYYPPKMCLKVSPEMIAHYTSPKRALAPIVIQQVGHTSLILKV